MKESDIFERADLILGERYNRAKVKTLCDEVFAAGIKRGAEMTRAAMGPQVAESQCQRCAGNGTILRLSDNSPDAHDVEADCPNCEGAGVVDAPPKLRAEGVQAGDAVAYLDLGAGGYMDVGTDLTDEQLAALPKGRHRLAIIGTHGVNGYTRAALASAPVADANRWRWISAQYDDMKTSEVERFLELLGLDASEPYARLGEFVDRMTGDAGKPAASDADNIPDFGGGSGNKAKRRAAALQSQRQASAPVAGEAYQGDNVAERLDNMADDQPPGSQAQSDLYAAATIWRKHIAHRAAPQASEAVRNAAQSLIDHKNHAERIWGEPFPETIRNPSTGKTEDNGLLIPVRLLRQLAAALAAQKQGGAS